MPATNPIDKLTLRLDCRKRFLNNERLESIAPYESGCEIELATANFFTEFSLLAHQNIGFLVINIARHTLVDLLQLGDQEQQLKMILLSNPSFANNTRMTIQMEKVFDRTPFKAEQFDAKLHAMRISRQGKVNVLVMIGRYSFQV